MIRRVTVFCLITSVRSHVQQPFALSCHSLPNLPLGFLPPASVTKKLSSDTVNLVNYPERPRHIRNSLLKDAPSFRRDQWCHLLLSPGDEHDTGDGVITEAGHKTPPQNADPYALTADRFGPLLPVARAVDDATGGWGLSYADLRPATPRTIVGQAFLATNFCYAAAGLALGVRGEWLLGGLTEVAGIVSFWYHYSQLEFGRNRSEVRLALLVDYITAGLALITGGAYMIQAGVDSIPFEAVASGAGAAFCLALCWVWEFGYPYVFWHSLWHVLSAYTGYLIGQDHISKLIGA